MKLALAAIVAVVVALLFAAARTAPAASGEQFHEEDFYRPKPTIRDHYRPALEDDAPWLWPLEADA